MCMMRYLSEVVYFLIGDGGKKLKFDNMFYTHARRDDDDMVEVKFGPGTSSWNAIRYFKITPSHFMK